MCQAQKRRTDASVMQQQHMPGRRDILRAWSSMVGKEGLAVKMQGPVGVDSAKSNSSCWLCYCYSGFLAVRSGPAG